MSLHPEPIPPVPEETARVAHAAFPKGNIYLKIRESLGSIYIDEDFADLFSVQGQPAQSPWRARFNLCHAVQVRSIRSSSSRRRKRKN